jgi:hypothetical protein
MKNLFLVSVAIGIFSGTSLSVKAQPAVNLERINTIEPASSSKFIDAITINTGTAVSGKTGSFKTVVKNKAGISNADLSSIETFSSVQFKYAQLLNTEVESLTNTVLFNEIEKWWGTRYRYGGATEKGIDCSAYTGTLVHQVYGVVLQRTARDQYAECFKIEQEEMQQGDLVFFRTGRGVSHVGLYLGNGYFTHASTSIGVTISNLSETYWSKKFIGGGRIIAPAPVEAE